MAEDNDFDKKIRERAFKLWQDAGSPDGRHEEFWHQAKEELENTQSLTNMEG